MRFQFPKLTPLQSRFTASLAASLLLFVIYLILSRTNFAYAADLESIHNQDHNHHRLLQEVVVFPEEDDVAPKEQVLDVGHEASFESASRSILERQDGGADQLRNNVRQAKTISADSTDVFVFSFQNATTRRPETAARDPPRPPPPPPPRNQQRAESAEHLLFERDEVRESLSRRQNAGRVANITLSVCFQPTTNATGSPPLPALSMSVSSANGAAGGTIVPVIDGYGYFQTNGQSDSVSISVRAPQLPSGYSGDWNYEIAASTDDTPFHMVETGPFNGSSSPLFLTDSDSTSALMITKNISRTGEAPSPHILYIFSTNSSQMQGLSRSLCAANLFSNATQANITHGVTQRYSNDADVFREQFLIENLSPNTNYTAVLALPSTDRERGGGTIWSPRSFMTKRQDTCQLVFDLEFCEGTAYSVPANRNKFPTRAELGAWYDTSARNLYQAFNYTMQQVPCNVSDTARYSLVRGCSDCERDYKSWLCAVTIPRCTDIELPNDTPDPARDYWYRKPRNLNSSSPTDGNQGASQLDLAAMSFYDGYPPNHVQKPILQIPGLDSLTNQAQSQVRNAETNTTIPLYLSTSRLPAIDSPDGVQPGPYREILPCIDYCHHLVQSCPASLKFGCPVDTRLHPLQSRSYGRMDLGVGPGGEPVCNFVGALWGDVAVGGAGRLGGGSWWILGSLVVAVVLVL